MNDTNINNNQNSQNMDGIDVEMPQEGGGLGGNAADSRNTQDNLSGDLSDRWWSLHYERSTALEDMGSLLQELSRVLRPAAAFCDVHRNTKTEIKGAINAGLARTAECRLLHSKIVKIDAEIDGLRAATERERAVVEDVANNALPPKERRAAIRENVGQQEAEPAGDGFVAVTRKKRKSRKDGDPTGPPRDGDRHNERTDRRTKLERTTTRAKSGKRQFRGPRAEAVMIKPAAGSTYADVVHRMRAGVDPAETKTVIRTIRRTREGHVLVEVGSSENRAAFNEAVRRAAGQAAAAVTDRVPKMTLEIRDMDTYETEQTVKDALTAIGVEDAAVRLTRENSRGLRLATVTVNETRAAMKLLELGRIKVGWVNCRVRRRNTIIRCYRCFGYGHRSADCEGTDRSGSCYKCGEEGHKAAVCANLPTCFLCAESKRPEQECRHIAGSSKCAALRQALDEKAKRTRNGR